MNIQISEHFTYRKLMRFIFPSIMMMIFSSLYSVVDGFFISNYVGKTQFAAIMLITPFIMIFGAIGFMIGTGGSALVAKQLGEQDKEKANRTFSLLIYVTIIFGIAVTIIGLLLLEPIARLLGADENMLPYCITYGRILFPALTGYMLQYSFQSLFVTAEKPMLGLIVTLISGLTNIVLDALFIIVFNWGVVGAGIATATGQIIGGAIPLIYFGVKNSSQLRLGRTKWDGIGLLKTCTNGSSEFMTNISMSIVQICYNLQLIRFAGENGIAAYGVIVQVNYIFASVFLGYAIGSAPITGYHYGAKNGPEVKNVLRKSFIIIGVLGVVLTTLAELLAYPLALLYVGYDAELLAMTTNAFRLYSFSFLFTGFNMYASSFFTSLNNGAVSAAISFLRTLLFQIASVFLLPLILGINGVWLSVVVAEILALLVSLLFIKKMRKKYQY